MKSINKLRKQTGLTQRQLAVFIGKEHTQLHRFESGERTPCAKSMKNIGLVLHAVEMQAAANGSIVPNASTKQFDEKAFMDHAFGCKVQAQQLRRQLLRIENKAAQCISLLSILPMLEQQQLSVLQKRWIDEQSYQATKKLEGCNTDTQARLRIRIQLLEMEAALHEEAINK